MSQCLFSRNIYYIKNEIVQKSAKFMNKKGRKFILCGLGNDSNLLIVFYVQIMPDDFVMQLHRF
ncbi:hypothetical protein DS207_17650 [Salmonella enterica subsp. enterica serovar Anatum]|nr:hypothetical protein [Salmonella enterica subsp. enterica serovar Anatum]EBS6267324.1 hypothetical protein [Salmonella enterica subsp. enterica serovar Anatum]EBV0161010.1 hypothetical protein [Salmonella enterica subsp. enterica serovar Anatum]EBW4451912.1 hypothetical protein [Salmonella enterica subsp. enterica serovar Anatum]EBX3899240.1 hypothetical protein [Salmonella enterica subsp. enterica serovar Anatum]